MSVDRDTLVAYALGALSEAEEGVVVAHLRSHPSDAAFVRDLFESLAEVAMSEPPAAVPASSTQSLLERIRELPTAPGSVWTASGAASGTDPHPPRAAVRPRPVIAWGALAAAAVLIVIAITVLRPFDANARIEARLDRTCAVTGTVCEDLVAVDGATLGTLARRADGTSLTVLTSMPPANRAYQAWVIVEGKPLSLGVFEVRVLELQSPLTEGAVFAVTVEPPGGSPLPTTQPIFTLPI